MNARFSRDDCQALENCVYDAAAEPSFELLKYCLVWPDERPQGLSRDGWQLLGDLWIVRGFIHRGVPFEEWGLDPSYFRQVWEDALLDCPRWPGFSRLTLSTRDRKYLEACLKEATNGMDY